MARATGLEPAASGVTGRRSNQLSYARSLNAQVQRAVTIGRLRERESPVKHALRGVEGSGIAHRSALADERSGHEFQGHERRSRVRRVGASASDALKGRSAGSSRDARERSPAVRPRLRAASSPARTSCDPMPWRWAAGRSALGASATAATSRASTVTSNSLNTMCPATSLPAKPQGNSSPIRFRSASRPGLLRIRRRMPLD